MNAELIMYGIIATGVGAWIVWYIIQSIITAQEKRELERQIVEGEIPRDYSRKLRAAMRLQNTAILATGMENEERFSNLMALRGTVAIIRAMGYDKAMDDRFNNIPFVFGIADNPHSKESGAAQQWARGYCQASGTQPKEWMAKA